MERRLKTLESTNEELSSETDISDKVINSKISELEAKLSNKEKSTSTNCENISDIKKTLDNITMKGGEESSHEISDDNSRKD